MAIVRVEEKVNNRDFIKTYSDKNVWIERDGVEYTEAYDPKELAEDRIYTETDKPIEVPEVEE